MATDEPNMRHPKIQRLIGANARYNIEAQLVEDLLNKGSELETTSLDMEYWNSTHDKLQEVLEDAERYRYLRNRTPSDVLSQRGEVAGCWIDCDVGTTLTLLTGADADKAIDAAIKKCK